MTNYKLPAYAPLQWALDYRQVLSTSTSTIAKITSFHVNYLTQDAQLLHRDCATHLISTVNTVTRAGSVQIFQIRFDSVRFSISSSWFGFFSFGFCTSPQWRRMHWVKHPKNLKL